MANSTSMFIGFNSNNINGPIRLLVSIPYSQKWNKYAWFTLSHVCPVRAGGRGSRQNIAVQGPFGGVMGRAENGSQRKDMGWAEWGVQMGTDLHAPHPHLTSQPLVLPVPGTISFKALPTHWVGFHSLLEGGHVLDNMAFIWRSAFINSNEKSHWSWALLWHRIDPRIRHMRCSVNFPQKGR